MTSRRPLIGITTQTLQAIEGIPGELPPSVVMNQQYHRATAAAGGVPVLIPLMADDLPTLRALYERLDGVLIPGGVDMDPASYGETPHEKLGRIDPARDATELQLARWAIDEQKPLLGVCRGVQVLNVACGGTLHQDIGTEVAGAMKHDWFPDSGARRDYLAHTVAIAPQSRLHAIVACAELPVNSLHHQSINTLGAGLRETAVATDGIVEAVERDGDAFVVGVQWHPEVFAATDARALALFRALVDAASHA